MYKLHVLLLFLLLSIFVNAQVDEVYTGDTSKVKEKIKEKPRNTEWRKKFFFGGMVMPGFFNNTFYATGNPHLGYRVTDKLAVGFGGNFTYISQRIGSSVYRQSIYGPFSFARYMFGQSFFLQAQGELLNQQNIFSSTNINERTWVPYLMGGGGYMQRFGDNFGSSVTILYNFIPNQLSIYRNPIIQVGFMLGF